MAFPASHYRDPLRIVIAQESRSCKGCVHREFAFDIQFCQRHENRAGSKMKKCQDYREG